MDSDDGLPALEPVDHIPPSINGSNFPLHALSLGEDHADTMQPEPPLIPVIAPTSDWDDDNMPSLMSVSDSSEEQDEFVDDDNSEWEDEDDAEFEGHGLLPPRPFAGARPGAAEDGGVERMTVVIPLMAHPTHRTPGQTDQSWLPPRRSPPGELPDFLTNIPHMRTMLDVLHLGPSGAGSNSPLNISREIAERLMMHAMAAHEEPVPLVPDPERAKVLVQGLEGVPKGLLVRMARVGGAPGAHEDLSGDEESVMAGCAVCWAPLLDENLDESGLDDEQPLPFASEVEESKIVSLPCAHVFHSACLLPWFSRGITTCPTCRFDIDPDALTWKPPSRHQARSFATDGANATGIEVPLDDWEDETDVDDDEDIDDDEPDLLESVTDFDNLFFNNVHSFTGGGFRRPELRAQPPRDAWTLPLAPGKTLRERIMEKEHEMGLRCMNLTCVLAPTDDDPVPRESDTPQISIRTMDVNRCKHKLHLACLVMSTRAAGHLPSVNGDEGRSAMEVSCPRCRTVGTVSKKDWDEGVEALAQVDC